MMINLPLTLFSRLTDYWHSLSPGARDNIIGGLIVAVLLGVLALFRKATVATLKRTLFGSSPTTQPPSQDSLKNASRLIPHIPSLMIDFVRRQDADGSDIVQRIKHDLMPGRNRLVALWGAGGVGKTAIAAEVALSLTESFQGRVLWVSADGRNDFALSTLLDEIAEKLGRSDLRPLSLEQKTGQTRDVVAAAPTLIVLDNFETINSAEQSHCMEWLTTRTPCSTLITTRQKLEKARNIPIDHMSPSEAHSLLERLIALTRNSDAFASLDRNRIIQIAEANPLILQWIVGQIDLAQEPKEVLDDLAHGEGDAAQRVFDRSFNLQLLENGGRAVLLALSMFVPSATRRALSEVAGLGQDKDKRRFREAVKNLAALWLIQMTEGGQRLAVVGLTRELAKVRLSSDSRAIILRRRFVTRFLRFAQSHGHVSASDLNALEIEKDNILSAMDVAVANKEWESVLQLIGAIQGREGGLLDIRGYWEDCIKCNKQALAAAKALEDESAIAIYSGNLAGIFMNRGQYGEARRITQQALVDFRSLGDEKNTAAALYNTGLAASGEGDLAEARSLYDESAAICKRLGNQSGLANNLDAIGRVVQSRGDFEEARRLYNESLHIKKQINDESGIAMTLYWLGTVAEAERDLTSARQLYAHSLRIQRRLGDQLRIAECLESQGRLAKNAKQRAEAAQLLREALLIYENLKSPDAEMVRKDLAAVERHPLLKWLH